MGRMTVTGLDDFSARIGKLGSASAGMIRQSMYDGAAQMKAAYEAEILALPAAEHHPLKEGELMTGITDTNRQDLLNGLYVRKFATEGGQHYTVIGFSRAASTPDLPCAERTDLPQGQRPEARRRRKPLWQRRFHVSPTK